MSSLDLPTTSTKDDPRPRALSPTALNTFSQCPKRFHFAYIERPEVEEEPSAQLVLGNAVHKALAFLLRLPVAQRSPEVGAKALRHFWAQIPDRAEAFSGEAEEIEWGRRALRAIAWYCESYGLEAEPAAIEEWVQARLPSGDLVGGRVDRVDRKGASLEVIDYKTGSCRIEREDLPHDTAAQIYAIATSRSFGRAVSRVRLIFLCDETERTWDVEYEDLVESARRLESEVAEVRAETEFPPRPDFHCRWCRYRKRCPARDRPTLGQLAGTDVPF